MFITWLGYTCFKIQGKTQGDVTVITDPFDSKLTPRLPKTAVDIVALSKPQGDYANLAAIKGESFIINGPGEYETKGVFIYGIADYGESEENAAPKNPGERNTIYRIELDQIKIAHLGFTENVLTDSQVEQLENVDILMIPVGGGPALNAKKAAEVINEIEPRLVIPMNYKCPGMNVKLDGLEIFLKEMGVKNPEKTDKLRIVKKDLPQEETRVVILNC